MKGAGEFKGHMTRDVFSDDLTRRGPIPLTIKRPRATPTPIDVDFPIVASVDVDLGTPAPLPFPISSPTGLSTPLGASPLRGDIAMNPNARLPSPRRPYIQPTPTFSFTDEPELWQQPPRATRGQGRSGPGLFSVLVLMVIAGMGGYATV